MKMYKAHWFIHNEFSYGRRNAALLQPFSEATNRDGSIPINRRPNFLDGFRRNAIVTSGEAYKRNIRRQSIDPDEKEFKPIYEKICGPSWLSINRAGLISGTPDDNDIDENYQTMMIRVSDRSGLSDVAEFNFKVKAPETPAPSRSPTTKATELPTNHPTTFVFAHRSNDFNELIYFSPELVGSGWKAEDLGPFGRCAGVSTSTRALFLNVFCRHCFSFVCRLTHYSLTRPIV